MNPTMLKLTIVVISCSTFASTKQKAGPAPTSAAGARMDRVCTQEFGITVCRNAETAPAKPAPAAAQQPGAPTEPGRLLLLLDVPANVFDRLAADPERNREYHPKQSSDYKPEPPAPANAGKYVRTNRPDGSAWRSRPKTSAGYRPKQDWSYNRDVFGRLWRQNIQHDTRVVEVPIDQSGAYLLPVGSVR